MLRCGCIAILIACLPFVALAQSAEVPSTFASTETQPHTEKADHDLLIIQEQAPPTSEAAQRPPATQSLPITGAAATQTAAPLLSEDEKLELEDAKRLREQAERLREEAERQLKKFREETAKAVEAGRAKAVTIADRAAWALFWMSLAILVLSLIQISGWLTSRYRANRAGQQSRIKHFFISYISLVAMISFCLFGFAWYANVGLFNAIQNGAFWGQMVVLFSLIPIPSLIIEFFLTTNYPQVGILNVYPDNMARFANKTVYRLLVFKKEVHEEGEEDDEANFRVLSNILTFVVATILGAHLWIFFKHRLPNLMKNKVSSIRGSDIGLQIAQDIMLFVTLWAFVGMAIHFSIADGFTNREMPVSGWTDPWAWVSVGPWVLGVVTLYIFTLLETTERLNKETEEAYENTNSTVGTAALPLTKAQKKTIKFGQNILSNIFKVVAFVAKNIFTFFKRMGLVYLLMVAALGLFAFADLFSYGPNPLTEDWPQPSTSTKNLGMDLDYYTNTAAYGLRLYVGSLSAIAFFIFAAYLYLQFSLIFVSNVRKDGMVLNAKFQSTMIGHVRHRLGHDLGAVTGGVANALKQFRNGNPLFDHPRINETLGNLERAERALDGVIDWLEQLRRFDLAGNLWAGDEKWFDLKDCVTEAIEDSRAYAGTPRIGGSPDWILEPDWQVPENVNIQVFGEKYLFGDVLRNLLNNAVKAILKSQRNGQPNAQEMVKLTIFFDYHLPKPLTIWVEDTAPDIPEAVEKQMFEPYFTTGANDKDKGSGLGLSMAREVVDHMQGNIDYEFVRRPGSTFQKRFFLNLPANRIRRGNVDND